MSKLPGALAAFGFGALSVGGALTTDISALEPYRAWIDPLVLGLLVIGLAALPGAGLAFVMTRDSVVATASGFLRGPGLLDDRAATLEDLPEVVRLGRGAIGDAHPGEDLLRARMKRNSRIIRVIYDRASTSEKILGYTILYPLSKTFTDAILAGEKTGIGGLPVVEISERFEDCEGLYVSMIFGSTLASKAAAITLLRGQIRRALLQSPNIKLVFGRPATAHGFRLLRQYGFSPLTAEENIWASDEDTLQAQREDVLSA
ncbi:MAG: hypothetical protein AAF829_02210 [Pseudomonadota bacterium]